MAEIPIRYQGWEGKLRIGISSQLPSTVLIGTDLSEHVKSVLVLTRSQKVNEGTAEENEIPGEIMTDNSDQAELIQLSNPQNNTFTQEQKADSTLKCCFENITEEPLTPERPERFLIEKDLLYREFLVNPRKGGENLQKQLVVPLKYCQKIIERGHSDVFSTHLGITKTKQRISQNFYWPEMGKQIKDFCQKCDVWQRQGNSNDKTKAKLCLLPIISTPFQRIGLDIIGLLPRVTQRGN